MFGVRTRPVQYGAGVYWEAGKTPLAAFTSVDEIEANYIVAKSDSRALCPSAGSPEGKGGSYGACGEGSEPMLTYKQLRGEEQAFLDLLGDIPKSCIIASISYLSRV